ncbi:Mobile element protein [Candidatus Enterovibrio altilux]|uniref:Mobile element protein n=1 Tax=Candidatus Enterovibrio altilux TaxID=1927128 RepID=A0A291B6P4_9GAMM|nr:Mobile element protein [Candidatus Enterovibrio luxaltus]
MLLRGLQVFINYIFKFAQLSLSSLHYSCISKRAKTANVRFKMKTKGIIPH